MQFWNKQERKELNMIKLSQNIKRILARMEKTMEEDVICCSSSANAGEKKAKLQDFRKFKESLENQSSPLMQCFDDELKKAMLRITHKIWKYCEEFTGEQLYNVIKYVVMEDGLFEKLERFLQRNPEDPDANALLNFFNNPCASSWEQGDSYCYVREFKYITIEDYEALIEKEDIDDFTDDKEKTQIRMAFRSISEEERIEEKGLYMDYKNFMYEQDFSTSALEDYRIWFDVMKKGIYYVYIPDIPE